MNSAGWAVVRFTLLRVLLLAGVWVLVQVTPGLRGLTAIVVALLISGLISLVVLNRQRDAMGEVVAGFFRSINARIDASARAEDCEETAEGQAVEQDK